MHLRATSPTPREALARLISGDGRRDDNAVVIGLLGRGIGASRSPIMHEREGARLGLNYAYRLIDFDRLELEDGALADVIEAAEELGFSGLNITHPFKQSVIPFLKDLSPEARAIGAVNTVVLHDAVRTGHNTDSWGFAESFREKLPDCPLRHVVQLGAGGAGAAVAYALLEMGVARLGIYDKAGPRAAALAERLQAQFGAHVQELSSVAGALNEADGIVNATPIGMEKYPGLPFDGSLLASRHWVAEVVYFPAETALLQLAQARGCRTLPGLGMAIYQALRAFELFTGLKPDRTAMAAHFAAGGSPVDIN
jgi:shikimate dehydrogenase